ncbi:hypothetical protein ACFLRR_01700 [Bacteroidota bacterium]
MKIKYILLISISLLAIKLKAQDKKQVYPGADEKTPSLSQYFSWINNTNEGSTEAQTLANLDFFKWLHDDYGMILDIYVVSAGAIDKGRWYGSMESDEFKTQFPNGFEPIYLKAKEMGTRLGTWGGPDGFGNTAKEEQKRIDMIVKLCKDYEFRLLKFDAVVGQLRDEKQEAFIRMMTECRKYSPDLIFLNHRLNLSEEARKHATTSLWGGVETYIDVHMPNWKITAPHHRASALSRDVVPGLIRLTEDHGVCLSSCLDYWEDDLVLQAFNRSLILSPQLYGNPWFLKDDEYPKLARIFNLARKYGDILVEGIVLPENIYGLKAVSRGDNETRLITLRNLEWDKKSFNLTDNEVEVSWTQSGEFELSVTVNNKSTGDYIGKESLTAVIGSITPTWNSVEFKLNYFDAIIKEVAQPGNIITYHNDWGVDWTSDDFWHTGRYQNGTFTASWDVHNRIIGWSMTGYMELTFNEQLNTISGGTIHANLNNLNHPENHEFIDITLGEINANVWEKEQGEFRLYGKEGCNPNIIRNIYHEKYSKQGDVVSWTYSLESYSCDGNSQFYIRFKTE